ALRAAAPVVAGIRDQALNIGYVRNLAGWLGMEPSEVSRAVASARSAGPARTPERPQNVQRSGGDSSGAHSGGYTSENSWARQDEPPKEDARPHEAGPSLVHLPTDPATRLERDAIMAILQQPAAVGRELIDRANRVAYANPSLAVVRDAITASMDAVESAAWLDRVIDEVPGPFATLVKELGVAPLPEREGRELGSYCQGITIDLISRDLLRGKAEMLGRLQRTDASAEPEKYREIQRELVRIETERRALRTE
ncbi:MAG: DNA primase, partial [Lacisediminihabitans sp.]